MSGITYTSEFEERYITWPDGSKAHYHGNIWTNLEIMKAKIPYKHQNVILITGRTGTGKSEFAIQCAKFLDLNFGIDNIFWNTDDLIKVAASKDNVKPPGTAFIFDEAREGTQSLNAMTETNRRMGLFLDTIRSRGYHIFLLQPSYFMFQRSIAVYAADILFHIEKRGNPDFYQAMKDGKIGDENVHEPFTRGIGRIYDVNQKKNVYIKGKRMEDMDASSCTYFSFKRSMHIVDWDEYERRKTIAVAILNQAFEKDIEPKLSAKAVSIIEFKQKAYYMLSVKCGVAVTEIARYFEEHSPNVSNYIGNERSRLEQIRLEGVVPKPEPAIESDPDPDEESPDPEDEEEIE